MNRPVFASGRFRRCSPTRSTVDALPSRHRDVLIWQRLARMGPGDEVRLTSAVGLHPVWRRQHACNHNSHIWVYEECGPTRWRALVTRRSLDDY